MGGEAFVESIDSFLYRTFRSVSLDRNYTSLYFQQGLISFDFTRKTRRSKKKIEGDEETVTRIHRCLQQCPQTGEHTEKRNVPTTAAFC